MDGLDTLRQQAAVRFQLGLPRAAQADPALLALQVGPAPHQAGGQVLELGQLHLQLAFKGARPLGKDIEDQAGAIQHPAGEHPFQVTFLAGRQGVVEDHHVRFLQHRGLVDFLGLAAAHEQTGIGPVATGSDGGDRGGAGRDHQLREFKQVVGVRFTGKVHVNQYRPFTAAWTFEQSATPG